MTDRQTPPPGVVLSPEAGYDLAASSYDEWYWRDFWRRNELPLLRRAIGGISRGGGLLDVGCATGEYLEAFGVRGLVVGMDLSRRMLEQARCRLGSRTQLVRADMRAMPFKGGSFARVVAARCLSHMPSLGPVFREIARVTRPSGRLIVSEVSAGHDYEWTRIPTPSGLVYIETYKRSLSDVVHTFESGRLWRVVSAAEHRWDGLEWKPTDPRFDSIDRSGRRSVFYTLVAQRTALAL